MDLSTSTEAELLGLMALQHVAPESARAAWEELYTRHRRYLFAVVSRSYGRLLGEDGTTDLVVDTFRRAYEWAGRQEDRSQLAGRFAADDRDVTRRKILGWLSVIAERLFKDRFREQASDDQEFARFLNDWKQANEQPYRREQSSTLTLLEAALAELGTHDADALRASLPWYDLDSGTFAVPRGEAARLAAILGITPEVLRQRRHRALKSIEQYFQKAGFVSSDRGESS